MVALSYFHRSNAHTLSRIFRTDLRADAWQARYYEEAALSLRLSLAPERRRPKSRAARRDA